MLHIFGQRGRPTNAEPKGLDIVDDDEQGAK